MKPIVIEYSQNTWEFAFPPEIDNEEVYSEYWSAVELLDDQDHLAEEILKSLINRHPYYIDAYNHLSIAFKNQNKRFESFLTAEKAYLLGKTCFPEVFKIGKDMLTWSCLNNRPFLRACQIYGLECQDKGDFDSAINLYKEGILLNESDNQGLRYLYLECLFAKADIKGAMELLNKHSDDYSVEFVYGLISCVALLGDGVIPVDLKDRALKLNPFVPSEIVKSKHKAPPPHRIQGEPLYDGGFPMGSIQEAYEYWNRNKMLYSTKRIVDFYKLNML